jgi:peptidoglycan hydrolase-like amidase
MFARIALNAYTSRALLAIALIAIVFIPVCSSVVAQGVDDSGLADLSRTDSSVEDVHVGVLGLFHPLRLTVSAPSGSAVVVHAGNERIVLEKSSGIDSATVSIAGGSVTVTAGSRTVKAFKVIVSGRRNEPADFVLAVQEKITRRYHGILEIKPNAGVLTAVVAMDLQTAVASVVAAEAAPDAPFEAMKAQAVSTRSYFVAARGRHHEFDFCDTTHCQFLREIPSPASAAARAAAATRDLVLAYDAHPLAAMYTRSCSGRTHTPAEVGLPPASYPYYSVECRYCREHPGRWSSRLPTAEATVLRASDENARLIIDRRLGWSTLPSNDFVVKKDRDQLLADGIGEGHGIGLCQAGAKAMAREGADFRQILRHYYPDTAVVAWPGPASSQRGPAQTARFP